MLPESWLNLTGLAPAVNGSTSSKWQENINPQINTDSGHNANKASSRVIIENVSYETLILTIILVVIAMLFVIHFFVGCYRSHIRIVRQSERKKLSANLTRPTAVEQMPANSL